MARGRQASGRGVELIESGPVVPRRRAQSGADSRSTTRAAPFFFERVICSLEELVN